MPEIPADRMEVIVDGGAQINFEIEGGRNRAESRTRLKAEAAIFIDENRRPSRVIHIWQGSNDVEIVNIEQCDAKYRVKIDNEELCKVKYDVKNVGNPRRPELDPWIIIRR